jgi:hypothetical protein
MTDDPKRIVEAGARSKQGPGLELMHPARQRVICVCRECDELDGSVDESAHSRDADAALQDLTPAAGTPA